MTNNSTTDDDEVRQKFYFEFQTECFKRSLSNTEAFDKAILSYSTGALALSLGFLKDFSPKDTGHFYLLFSSWMLFVAAMLTIVISFLVGDFAIKRELKKAERYFLERQESALVEKNYAVLATSLLNWFAGVAFCVGALLTALFVTYSIEG